jgi:hypothetical protein
MARLMFPGTGKIRWVTTLSSVTAPTAIQVNAGVDLTPWLRQDGLNRTMSGNETDTADARDTFNRSDIGTYDATLECTFLRDTDEAEDDAFTTLPRGTRGYMVVAPFGWATGGLVAVADDRCEVWPAVVSSRGPESEGANKAQVIKIIFALPDTPELEAVVA